MIWFCVLVALLMFFSRVVSQKIERDFPPIGRFFDAAAGVRLHYHLMGTEHAGRGTLVMIHGASSNLLDFNSSIAPILAKQFQVLLVDRPGLGHTRRQRGPWMSPSAQAALVQSLIDELNIRDLVLIGHSWAGSLVMAHLLTFPGLAGGGVLIAPATHSWDGPSAWYNRLSRVPILGWLFRWTLVVPLGRLALDSGIRSIFHQGQVPDHYRQRAGIDLVLRPHSWLANADDLCLLNGYLKENEQRYWEVQTPLLALIGENDQTVWNEIHVGGLERQVRDLTIVRYGSTAHAPHQSHPARVADEILKFTSDILN